jgi:hypothetical protein
MDRATQRIADESRELRTKFDTDNVTALELLTENNRLRKVLTKLEQEHEISEMRVEEADRECERLHRTLAKLEDRRMQTRPRFRRSTEQAHATDAARVGQPEPAVHAAAADQSPKKSEDGLTSTSPLPETTSTSEDLTPSDNRELLPETDADVTGPLPEAPHPSDEPTTQDNSPPPTAAKSSDGQGIDKSNCALPEEQKEVSDSEFEGQLEVVDVVAGPQKDVDDSAFEAQKKLGQQGERKDQSLPEGPRESEEQTSPDTGDNENPSVDGDDAAPATFLPDEHLPTSPAVGPFSARLASIRTTHAMRVGAAGARARAARSRNVALKEGVAVAARDLAAAECARFDRLRREFEYLQALDDAATFVLAALDKRFGPVPEEDATGRRKSALSAIIRKLATIRVGGPAPRRQAPPGRVDASVQTDWLPPVVPLRSTRFDPRKGRPKICAPARSGRIVRVGSVP